MKYMGTGIAINNGVAMRCLVRSGIIVIPRSVRKERMAQNPDI